MSRLKGAVKRFEDKGEVTEIGFLDENYIFIAQKYFQSLGFCEYTFESSWGDATRMFLSVGTYYNEQLSFAYLRFSPDKFHAPSHRDYMGALMSLGIDRKMFGDLIVTNNSVAFLSVWDKGDIVSYLMNEFLACGRAKLKCERVDVSSFDALQLQYEKREIIVSSLRADCIVSSLAGVSRSQAKGIVENGDFKISSSAVFEPDRVLVPSEVFSLRGYGKYRLSEIIGQTRKERIRIELLKFGNYIEREKML